jgi:aarF domain-containing kinase
MMVQFVASGPTLFPAEYVEEFRNCFDRAPAVPFDVIESILREELQRPLDSIYEYINPVPIASASIVQVFFSGLLNWLYGSALLIEIIIIVVQLNGARLRSSQKDVVIKVLKPGTENTLVADLNCMYSENLLLMPVCMSIFQHIYTLEQN